MHVLPHRVRPVALLAAVLVFPFTMARAQSAPGAQSAPTYTQAPPDASAPPPAAPPYDTSPPPAVPAPAPAYETRPAQPLTPGPQPGATPVPAPAPAPSYQTQPAPPLTPNPQAIVVPAPPPGTVVLVEPDQPPPGPLDPNLWLDGHRRVGPFLAGPGSLTFVLHHSIMGGLGGLATQAVPHNFSLELGSREQMLAGLLIGAAAGFGSSAWWQANHWIDRPMANFGIAASLIGGMFCTGLVDLASNDKSLLTWTAFIGAELAAWLTVGLAGGEFQPGPALAIGSGAAWGLAYAGLLLAILATSGTHLSPGSTVDTLLIAPGVGAGFAALSMLQLRPSPQQVLRADAFGAAVGVGVLVLAGVVLGRFDVATPYILSLLSSAAAITAVGLLWDEAAERQHPPPPPYYRSEAHDRRPVSVWW